MTCNKHVLWHWLINRKTIDKIFTLRRPSILDQDSCISHSVVKQFPPEVNSIKSVFILIHTGWTVFCINLHWWRGRWVEVWGSLPHGDCGATFRIHVPKTVWHQLTASKTISLPESGCQAVLDSSSRISLPPVNHLSWKVRQNADQALASQGGWFGSLCQWVKFSREYVPKEWNCLFCQYESCLVFWYH